MGMLEFVRTMASPKAPFALLEHVRSLPISRSILEFAFPIPGLPMLVVVGDAQVARQIWQDPDSKRATILLKSLEASMGGPNMLTTNGRFWKHRRQGVNPAFASKNIQRMQRVAHDKVEEWISNTIQAEQQTVTLDIAQFMLHLMLSIVSETAFEYCMSENQRTTFLRNNYLQIEEFFTKSLTNPLRMGLMWCLPERQKAWKASTDNLDICRTIVHAYKSKPESERTKGTMLECLVNNPCYKTEQELLADVLLLLASSHDTTAFTTAFVLIELAKEMDFQCQLRHELLNIRKKHEEQGHSTPVPWSESLLLQYAIKEAMRLYPAFAIGAGSRVVGNDVFFSAEHGAEKSKRIMIPKGSLAITSILMMQRDARLFQNPDQFQPLRWKDATEAQRQAIVPYAMGAQNCVGQALANAVLPIIAGELVCDHEISLVQEGTVVFAGSIKPVGSKLCLRRL